MSLSVREYLNHILDETNISESITILFGMQPLTRFLA